MRINGGNIHDMTTERILDMGQSKARETFSKFSLDNLRLIAQLTGDPLATKTYLAIARDGNYSVADLASMTDQDLMKINNIGHQSINMINQFLDTLESTQYVDTDQTPPSNSYLSE